MGKELHQGDMVANIVSTYQRATAGQVQAGRQWYPTAWAVVEHIATATGSNPMRVCYALSALSPRNPWRWNVADAFAFAQAKAEGRTMPKATTFNRNRTNAWQALSEDGQPWLTAAPKVNAFVDAIFGDENAVVVDTWAYRVATTVRPLAVGHKAYRLVAAAYRQAAVITGETPRDLQAITWLVAQTEGLASHRNGRHDLAFKAGTPDSIKALLGEETIA